MTNTILNRRGVPAGLFVSDPRTAEALAAKLAENGIDVVQQTHGAFVWANIIQNTNFAQLKTVVIELPASGDLIEAVKALAKHLDAGTSLILLGRESSVVFYHQLKRAGATDYYPLTTAPEEIAYGVKASLEPQQEQEAPVGGRVIAVFGAGYGIGAGTTATVLAAELAQTDPVIVVDAGLLMPSVGSYLGVDVPGSLPKMLQAQDRLDAVWCANWRDRHPGKSGAFQCRRLMPEVWRRRRTSFCRLQPILLPPCGVHRPSAPCLQM